MLTCRHQAATNSSPSPQFKPMSQTNKYKHRRGATTNEARRSIVVCFFMVVREAGKVQKHKIFFTTSIREREREKECNADTSYAFKVIVDPLFFHLGPCLCSGTKTDKTYDPIKAFKIKYSGISQTLHFTHFLSRILCSIHIFVFVAST